MTCNRPPASILVVDHPGAKRLALIKALSRQGHTVNALAPCDAALRLDFPQTIIQVISGKQPSYSDPFALHCRLAESGFSGNLLLLGSADPDPRIMDGLTQNAQALDLNAMTIPEGQDAAPELEKVCGFYRAPSNAPAPLLNLASPQRAELIQAMQDSRVVPWYQPIMGAGNLAIERVEVLARWLNQQGTPCYSPSQFIPMAELTGLVDPLFDLMLNHAIKDTAPLIRDGHLLGVSLNVTLNNLRQHEFIHKLISVVNKAGIEPGHITLEITESTLSQFEPHMLAHIARLRLAGFLVAIDDFGTGVSGLTHLSMIPFTELKLDRRFVTRIAGNTINTAICKGAIGMAEDIGMAIVAEGIETESDSQELTALGATYLQGFFFARAMPLQSLLSVMGYDSHKNV